MEEIWLKDNELLGKEEWSKLIARLKNEKKRDNKEEAKKNLREKLIAAIKRRIPQEKFGIFFSGGVDSTFIAAICKNLGADFVCYTVGFQEETKEPEDVLEAQKVAAKLGLKLQTKIYNLTEAEEIIRKTIRILRKKEKEDVVNVGVGSVVLAAAELGKKAGINCFFSGLGSEEIFAGYERHEKAKNVQEECWSGLRQMWERDLVRDFNLGKELGIVIKTPFLDKELIEFVMELPAEWKIAEGKKKVILREVAEEFLGEFAWRKKKAAQYGSCFDKAIGKLARQKGFKFKKDYLESW